MSSNKIFVKMHQNISFKCATLRIKVTRVHFGGTKMSNEAQVCLWGHEN